MIEQVYSSAREVRYPWELSVKRYINDNQDLVVACVRRRKHKFRFFPTKSTVFKQSWTCYDTSYRRSSVSQNMYGRSARGHKSKSCQPDPSLPRLDLESPPEVSSTIPQNLPHIPESSPEHLLRLVRQSPNLCRPQKPRVSYEPASEFRQLYHFLPSHKEPTTQTTTGDTASSNTASEPPQHTAPPTTGPPPTTEQDPPASTTSEAYKRSTAQLRSKKTFH
ncbi:hypothetical protein AVEN_58951-1 [Araneus ventricosus]|uniref:Uncharacterized protein n=1 Tax=Araneus ventricosus TaxID=182803 RepID=A0A4Y2UX54_ARAVE|nr:hypothetical protein AVEN_58951-1 [Araneus ventricosus]